jgi:hypothetical protein
MKTIKALITAVLFLIAFHANSQEHKMPPADVRAEKITNWMKTNLNLTEVQLPAVQSINLKYAKMNDEVKNKQDRKEKMDAVKSNEQAKEVELSKVLTKDQMKIYRNKKEEMKKALREEMNARQK